MRVAVVGATGAVGTLLLALLERRGFPADEVVPFASERSAGRQLGDNAINIMMISTSPIRISCVVPGDRVPDAVKALHGAFELSGEGTIRPEQPFGEFA